MEVKTELGKTACCAMERITETVEWARVAIEVGLGTQRTS